MEKEVELEMGRGFWRQAPPPSLTIYMKMSPSMRIAGRCILYVWLSSYSSVSSCGQRQGTGFRSRGGGGGAQVKRRVSEKGGRGEAPALTWMLPSSRSQMTLAWFRSASARRVYSVCDRSNGVLVVDGGGVVVGGCRATDGKRPKQ